MSRARIDFLRPRSSSWLGSIIFAVGAASLASSLWLDRHWTAQRVEREMAVRERDGALRQAQVTATKPIPPTADERRLSRVAPQLRQPWLPTLRLIEHATAEPVFLVGMAIDPSTGTVRLDAEAQTFEQALGYAHSLSQEGLIADAHLRSHEQINAPAVGSSIVRFNVVARWSAR